MATSFFTVASDSPETNLRFEPSVPWMDYAIVFLTILAPALGGATQLWSQALIALGCVTMILIAPPRRLPPRVVIGVFVGLLLLIAISFLPAHWFGTLPWRQKLIPTEGLDLPSTLSPQPRVTLENGLLFFAGILWASFLITRKWATKRRRLLATYALGATFLAALSLIFFVADWLPPFWRPYRGAFGFFPNRNQTANVLALGGIISLALAFHEFLRKRDLGYLWAAAYVLIGVSVVVCGSRAGVLLYLIGSFLWVVWTGWGRQEMKRLSLGASVVFFALTLFCTLGGKTLDRFTKAPDENDGRLLIQRDALRVLADTSWHGVGLGNFAPVFTQYRKDYIHQNRAVHPESDWLWLGIELGWLAPLLVLAGLFYWMRQGLPKPSEPEFRLRAAVFVCLIGFILHGLVDVSGHRMGSLWPALLFLALLSDRLSGEPQPSGLIPQPSRTAFIPHPSKLPSFIYRFSSILVALAALWWLMSLLPLRVPVTSASLRRLKAQIKEAQEFRADAQVIRHATDGLAFAPLDWDLYFSRALSGARSMDEVMPAALDFHRALHLEPNVAELPFIEGLVWLDRQPRLALGPWREALRRIGIAGRNAPEDVAAAKRNLYDRMLSLTPPVDSFHDEVRALALDDRDLMLVFMKHASTNDFLIELERMLLEDPKLQALDTPQRTKLFDLWGTKGDDQDLARRIIENPDWIEAGWFWLAANRASHEEFQAACEMAKQHTVAPALPKVTSSKPLLELRTTFLLLTNDISTGYILYAAQMEAGQTNEALSVLQHVTAKRSSPAYLHYLEAQQWMRRERWQEAWQAWLRFLGRR